MIIWYMEKFGDFWDRGLAGAVYYSRILLISSRSKQ